MKSSRSSSKELEKNLKKGLTNETKCGKIVKRLREKLESERTLKIKQRDERRTRDFWEFLLEELQETEPKKSVNES